MNHPQAPGARLQQQPRRFSDRQQQQSGTREFQPRRLKPEDTREGQMGQGGHEAHQGDAGIKISGGSAS